MVPTVLYNWPKSQSCWQICPFIFNAGAHAFLHFGYVIWLMSHCHMHGEYEISLNPCSGRVHYWSTYILEARRARCRNLYLYRCYSRRCCAPLRIISPIIKFNNVVWGADIDPPPPSSNAPMWVALSTAKSLVAELFWMAGEQDQIKTRYLIYYQSYNLSRNRHLDLTFGKNQIIPL